ncbi:hypothetical protein EDD80_10834 [Anseongella ginsenosidimutans]|uniref:Uncharacterized protein n=1 Tax=Anseongella ginsenosidimutans TaxID=496056 RepID=A0A4R3KRK3_9SPHI|nr:DUF5908 family protein [Anseongella ginsenosidimutans]TCS86243.1 hypothetical protein EDD80_10834 [Anseongella ginsenosidimutans]
MPIEIKELHIKAVVAPRQIAPSGWSQYTRSEYEKMRKELVKDCIEKILQLLDDKKER